MDDGASPFIRTYFRRLIQEMQVLPLHRFWRLRQDGLSKANWLELHYGRKLKKYLVTVMRLELFARYLSTNIINAFFAFTFATSLYPSLYLPATDSLPQHARQHHLTTQLFESTIQAPSNLSVNHSPGIH